MAVQMRVLSSGEDMNQGFLPAFNAEKQNKGG